MQIDRIPLFSTAGLLKMHGALQEALNDDDNLAPDAAKVYGVRQFPDWHIWADALEAELAHRQVAFAPVVW